MTLQKNNNLITYGQGVFWNADDLLFPKENKNNFTPSLIHAPSNVVTIPLASAQTLSEHKKAFGILFGQESIPEHGTFLYVPSGIAVDTQITIDVSSVKEQMETIVIVAGEGSSVVFRERNSFGDIEGKRTTNVVILASEGARVTYSAVGNFGKGISLFCDRRGIANKNATIDFIECMIGGKFTRSHSSVVLSGEGARTKMQMIFLSDQKGKCDVFQEAIHSASYTTSDLQSRGALLLGSKAIYRGQITVQKGTKGCSGNQKEQSLFLAPDAEMDAIPNLEISSSDVRCSHAASSGKIDDDALFYLQSRGLDRKTAISALAFGFFTPILSTLHEKGVRDSVECFIRERIEQNV